MTEQFKNQDYKELKKESIKCEQLFVDPVFPAENSSLFQDGSTNNRREIVWKRPGDIVENPQLFVDGASVNDITQGILGNCWFVSACSALTHNKKLLDKVIPDAKEQEWKEKSEYAGIFRFCFWRFGKWIEVVVDDYLPTEKGKLIFAQSKTNNEFWSALLEKAFAKLSGCYENLIGGHLADALQDVSGGVPERIDLTSEEFKTDKGATLRLFNELKGAFKDKALICAAIAVKDQAELEKNLDCGLVKGHAYAVTAIRKLELDAKNNNLMSFFSSNPMMQMVRLQNPWGGVEWTGPWSDGSPEWEQVKESTRDELGLIVDEDGEFWMPWDEFCRYFTDISVCHLINTSFFSFSKTYDEKILYGSWKASEKPGQPSDRAGGCLNFKATFLCNPQYRFDIKEDGADHMMFSLTQEDIRERRKENIVYKTIGIHVMKVEENRKYRLHQVMEGMGTSDYINSRSTYLSLRNLKRGRYVVFPTTYKPGKEGNFMLRVYSPQSQDVEEITKHKPTGGCCACCSLKTACVTRLTIVSAQGLEDKKGNRVIDPYCIVKCEGETVRSQYVKENNNPLFNFTTIFMRKRPQKHIEIELWDSNYLSDSFLGGVSLNCPVENQKKKVESHLHERKSAAKKMPGKITIEIATYDDPVYL